MDGPDAAASPGVPGPLTADEAGPKTPTEQPAAAGQRSSGELLGIVGAAALLVGLALLVLRWTSRRLA
jgi:hypothetical protein